MVRRLVMSLSVVALSCGALSGCNGQARKVLGLEKHPPDEFAVMRRAPLSVPPEFTLTTPQPGARRPQEDAPVDRARRAVLGKEGRSLQEQSARGQSVSRGEKALLSEAGAEKNAPDIRALLSRENTVRGQQDEEGLLDSLAFWRDSEAPGTIVDAAAEARRLRENKALGKSPTEGETPQIEKEQRAILEGVL